MGIPKGEKLKTAAIYVVIHQLGKSLHCFYVYWQKIEGT